MDNHVIEEPTTDDKKKAWLCHDTRLYHQIKNSIESDVGLVDHCDFEKELLEFLDFLYSRKEEVHQTFDVYMQFFRAE